MLAFQCTESNKRFSAREMSSPEAFLCQTGERKKNPHLLSIRFLTPSRFKTQRGTTKIWDTDCQSVRSSTPLILCTRALRPSPLLHAPTAFLLHAAVLIILVILWVKLCGDVAIRGLHGRGWGGRWWGGDQATARPFCANGLKGLSDWNDFCQRVYIRN